MFRLLQIPRLVSSKNQFRPILKISLSSIIETSKMVDTETNKLKEYSRLLLPDLQYENHKGQCGRIGVFGGSVEFTGAPYYAGYSALRTGVDLVYVFCAAAAAASIKSYSPELMVMPYLDHEDAVEKISAWLGRLHTILIGPGLGRSSEHVFNVLKKIIQLLNASDDLTIPLVFDADGLFFLSQNPTLLKAYKTNVYITPNVMEFSLLSKSLLGISTQKPNNEQIMELSRMIGDNVTIVLKGNVDKIVQRNQMVKCCVEGSPRRCGGQGDLLSGCLSAFAAWINIKKMKFENYSHISPELVAGYSACYIARNCNRLSFRERGRGMIVTDMLEKINSVANELFDEDLCRN